eukprot:scaffold221630_cov30-Tisochrysis_lutea.AAC.7
MARLSASFGAPLPIVDDVPTRANAPVRVSTNTLASLSTASCKREASLCSKQPRSSVVSVAVESTTSSRRRPASEARSLRVLLFPEPASPHTAHIHPILTARASDCRGRS